MVTDKNEFTIYKELIIRKVLQNGGKILPSANVFFDIVNENGLSKVIATGGGLGHGVGMSQWGAGTMAKNGYKYDDIIHHYYTDVNIAVKPVWINANTQQSTEFFIENKNLIKKSILRIDNNFKNSEINIIINDKSLDENMVNKLIRDKHLKISDYLKKGKNIITYDVKSNNTAKKSKFWIELE